LTVYFFLCCSTVASAQYTKSIRDFGVMPENDGAKNASNLQKAIDWAAARGVGLLTGKY